MVVRVCAHFHTRAHFKVHGNVDSCSDGLNGGELRAPQELLYSKHKTDDTLDEVAHLQQKLSTLQEENAATLTELRQQVQDLEEHQTSRENRLHLLEQKHDELEELQVAHATLNLNHTTTCASLQATTDRVSTLDERCKTLENELSLCKAHSIGISNELAEMSCMLANEKKELAVTVEALDTCTHNLHQVQETLRNRDEEMKQLGRHKRELQMELDLLQENASALEEEQERMKNDVAQAQEQAVNMKIQAILQSDENAIRTSAYDVLKLQMRDTLQQLREDREEMLQSNLVR